MIRHLILTSLFVSSAIADITMPEVFADHMILQRDNEVNVFGKASPNEKITVSFSGKDVSTITGANGKWIIKLPPMKASHRGQKLQIKGKNTIVINDILVGEVWHANGQSNMAWPLRAMKSLAAPYLEKADNPKIRFYNRQRQLTPKGIYADKQLQQSKSKSIYTGGWEVGSKKSALNFSAVGYIFAQEMYRELKVPVAILHTACGGTPTEAFISHEALQSNPRTKKLVDNWPYSKESQSGLGAAKCFKNVLEKGEKIIFGEFPYHHPWEPSILYETGIEPLIPYTIAGAIWYQGESNQMFPELHNILFPMMVNDWRKQWGIGDFPFYYVQLPSVSRPTWPEFREGQRQSLAELNNIGMAVTIDTGDQKRPSNVHPADKMKVGERLAYLAIQNVFKKNKILATGPLIKRAIASGSEIMITFDYSKGMQSSDGETLRYFEVAGSDGNYVPATALIRDDAITLSSTVQSPKSVRYAWHPFPIPRPNFCNALGHVASPFKVKVKALEK
ncbi:MAG: sialate O-acetylesterase [Akkermansiaceae bacterium]